MELKPFSQIGEGFDNHSRDEWKAQLIKELKDGNPTLLDATITDEIAIPGWLDNSVVQHIVHDDLAAHAAWADHPNAWLIAEEINELDPKAANAHALQALAGGASVLRFKHADGLNERLKGIHPEMCQLIFDKPTLAFSRFGKLGMLAGTKGKQFSEFSGLAATDMIADGLLHGGFQDPMEQWITECGILLSDIMGQKSQHMLHEIDGLAWRMAGGNHVDVLASMLAHGAELLHMHQAHGHPLHEVAARTFFRYPVGTDFLRDVAAIRALRVMWKAMLQEYNIQIDSVRVDAAMPYTELSAVDANTNMLRYTAAAMSATMAGCYALCTAPYNFGNTEHANRIARNVSLLLDNESHVSRVTDPLKGAYAVEAMTQSLAEAAWKQFNQLEAQGGLIAELENGSIQKHYAEQLAKRAEKLSGKKEVKVGVNKYTADVQPAEAPVFVSENRGQFTPLNIASIDQLCTK